MLGNMVHEFDMTELKALVNWFPCKTVVFSVPRSAKLSHYASVRFYRTGTGFVFQPYGSFFC